MATYDDSPITGEQRRYHITSILGQGGFGTVYRARMAGPEGFQKDVALKILRDRDPPPDVLSRFRDEARILGLIREPHVVSVEPPILLEGRWAIQMEYVDGTSCEELLRRRVFPPSIALQVLQVVAETLDHLWLATDPDGRPLHLIHRDLKPSNIQITPKGFVKLLDFGVARADFDARETHTQLEIGGTPGYMAPERLERVESDDDSQKGDIYSLGVVLHRLVTGQRPNPEGALHPDVLANSEVMLVVSLAASLRAEDPRARPTARDVAEQCKALLADVSQVDLSAWATSNVSATPLRAPDSLVGRTLSLTMSIAQASTMVRPATGRPLAVLALLVGFFAFLVMLGAGSVMVGALWYTASHRPVAGRTPEEPQPAAVVEPGPGSEPVAAPAPVAEAPPVEVPPVPASEPVEATPSHKVRGPPHPVVPKVGKVPTGRIVVVGEADEVELSCGGDRYAPGTVPAGPCDLTATFPGAAPVPAGRVSVPEGGTVTVVCMASFARCRAK